LAGGIFFSGENPGPPGKKAFPRRGQGGRGEKFGVWGEFFPFFGGAKVREGKRRGPKSFWKSYPGTGKKKRKGGRKGGFFKTPRFPGGELGNGGKTPKKFWKKRRGLFFRAGERFFQKKILGRNPPGGGPQFSCGGGGPPPHPPPPKGEGDQFFFPSQKGPGKKWGKQLIAQASKRGTETFWAGTGKPKTPRPGKKLFFFSFLGEGKTGFFRKEKKGGAGGFFGGGQKKKKGGGAPPWGIGEKKKNSVPGEKKSRGKNFSGGGFSWVFPPPNPGTCFFPFLGKLIGGPPKPGGFGGGGFFFSKTLSGFFEAWVSPPWGGTQIFPGGRREKNWKGGEWGGPGCFSPAPRRGRAVFFHWGFPGREGNFFSQKTLLGGLFSGGGRGFFFLRNFRWVRGGNFFSPIFPKFFFPKKGGKKTPGFGGSEKKKIFLGGPPTWKPPGKKKCQGVFFFPPPPRGLTSSFWAWGGFLPGGGPFGGNGEREKKEKKPTKGFFFGGRAGPGKKKKKKVCRSEKGKRVFFFWGFLGPLFLKPVFPWFFSFPPFFFFPAQKKKKTKKTHAFFLGFKKFFPVIPPGWGGAKRGWAGGGGAFFNSARRALFFPHFGKGGGKTPYLTKTHGFSPRMVFRVLFIFCGGGACCPFYFFKPPGGGTFPEFLGAGKKGGGGTKNSVGGEKTDFFCFSKRVWGRGAKIHEKTPPKHFRKRFWAFFSLGEWGGPGKKPPSGFETRKIFFPRVGFALFSKKKPPTGKKNPGAKPKHRKTVSVFFFSFLGAHRVFFLGGPRLSQKRACFFFSSDFFGKKKKQKNSGCWENQKKKTKQTRRFFLSGIRGAQTFFCWVSPETGGFPRGGGKNQFWGGANFFEVFFLAPHDWEKKNPPNFFFVVFFFFFPNPQKKGPGKKTPNCPFKKKGRKSGRGLGGSAGKIGKRRTEKFLTNCPQGIFFPKSFFQEIFGGPGGEKNSPPIFSGGPGELFGGGGRGGPFSAGKKDLGGNWGGKLFFPFFIKIFFFFFLSWPKFSNFPPGKKQRGFPRQTRFKNFEFFFFPIKKLGGGGRDRGFFPKFSGNFSKTQTRPPTKQKFFGIFGNPWGWDVPGGARERPSQRGGPTPGKNFFRGTTPPVGFVLKPKKGRGKKKKGCFPPPPKTGGGPTQKKPGTGFFFTLVFSGLGIWGPGGSTKKGPKRRGGLN